MAFGLSLAGAIYGYFYLSILLLFLSGVAITKESIRLREPDVIFIAVTSLMLLISITSAYGRDAYYEFLPLGFIYALSVYIFFIIKANYNHIHQTLGVVTVCFVISSFDLILGVLTEDKVTSLELIEQSITAAFYVNASKRLRASTACLGSGTSCSLRLFILAFGTVHIAFFKSNSDHFADLTEPLLSPV